ncbi:MAG: RNA polymerase sigma factor [Candidatus Aenigmatarchaeota archaeon]
MDIYNELFNKVKNNCDEEALKKLISLVNPWLYRVIYRIIKNTLVSEDILQETWIKVWENKDRYQNVKSFRNWIYTIAINNALKFIRDRKTKVSIEEVQEQLQFNEEDDDENIKLLNESIDNLDEKCRILIVLKYFESLSYQEIADILNTSLEYVRNHLFKCRKKLYKILINKGFEI